MITDLLQGMSARDLRALAFKMYDKGEDIAEVVELLHERDLRDKKNREL
ncbi:MAG: hypothetical protein UY48_C0044G0008 [Candidatus Gottesmanbacteria bacterium GW2011_GWB1_49_7]|uniref:Uncharacterized protein n=1 Tax=Candidatus Gottesmanbacteria bacterium GW2011_GWB1_49_7 TaxID=1618448 RepID=A0A0G1YV46_9BACT|nr:MAG: hypothetical protein UY48_C0044G0008 [Candidatus Gottesmanbacteria bacterium GW2011_GWB1_49_7]